MHSVCACSQAMRCSTWHSCASRVGTYSALPSAAYGGRSPSLLVCVFSQDTCAAARGTSVLHVWVLTQRSSARHAAVGRHACLYAHALGLCAASRGTPVLRVWVLTLRSRARHAVLARQAFSMPSVCCRHLHLRQQLPIRAHLPGWWLFW